MARLRTPARQTRMPNTLTLVAFAQSEPLQLRRAVHIVSNRAAACALFLGRLAMLVLAAYAGATIVQHFTEALCVAAGHIPPEWTASR